jgi:hypothetical protein
MRVLAGLWLDADRNAVERDLPLLVRVDLANGLDYFSAFWIMPGADHIWKSSVNIVRDDDVVVENP